MNIRIAAVTMLLLAFCVSVGVAQATDYNITGAGARAAGLGGAFIGVADDATAIVWNPAGLTQLERTEASIVVRSVTDKSTYTDKSDPANLYTDTRQQSHGVMNFVSIAFPFKLSNSKAVFAVAYQRQLDFYQKSVESAQTRDGTGGTDTFSPSFAVRLSPVVSLGVAANIWFGKDELQVKDTSLTLTRNGKPTGVNFIGGMLVDLSGLKKPFPLKFGFAIRTPFDLKNDQTITFNPPIGSYDKTDYTTTSQMPIMLGFGASVRPVEDLTIAVDYEIRKFGDRKETRHFKDALLESALGGEFDMSESKKDLNQVRVGAEYLVITRIGVIPVRVGFQTVPTLSANYNDIGDISGQAVGKGFSLGSGFISDRFAIDVTFSTAAYTIEWSGPMYSTEFSKTFLTISGIVYF